MRNAIAILMLAVAFAVVTAASGRASTPMTKAAYDTEMIAIGERLTASIDALNSVTTAKEGATVLAHTQADLRDAVKQLESITPPSRIKAAQRQLANAVGEFADELTPMIAKVKAGNLEALSTFATLKGLQNIRTATSAITKAGYTIST